MKLPAYDHEYIYPRMRDFSAFRTALQNEGYSLSDEAVATLYTIFRRVQ